MAFTLKYQASGTNEYGETWQVDLLFDGWSGAVTQLTLAAPDPYKIEWGDRGHDVTQIITDARCTLNILAPNAGFLSEIEDTDAAEARMDVYHAGTLVFRGYVEPSLGERTDGLNETVQVMARDGLSESGRLSASRLRWIDGRQYTLFDVARICLEALSYGLPYRVVCEWTCAGLLAENAFAGAYALDNIFDAKELSALEVLEQAVGRLGMNLRQSEGAWHFEQAQEKVSGTTTRHLYDNTGLLVSTEAAYDPSVQRTDALFRKLSRPSLVRRDPHKSVDVVYEHGPLGESIIQNGSFEDEYDVFEGGAAGQVTDGERAQHWTFSDRTVVKRTPGIGPGEDEEHAGYVARTPVCFSSDRLPYGSFAASLLPAGMEYLEQTSESTITAEDPFHLFFSVRLVRTPKGSAYALGQRWQPRPVLWSLQDLGSGNYWNGGAGAWEAGSEVVNSEQVASDNWYQVHAEVGALAADGQVRLRLYNAVDDLAVQTVAGSGNINLTTWQHDIEGADYDAVRIVFNEQGAQEVKSTTTRTEHATSTAVKVFVAPTFYVGDGPTNMHQARLTLDALGVERMTDWGRGASVPGQTLDELHGHEWMRLVHQTRRAYQFDYLQVSGRISAHRVVEEDAVRYWPAYFYWTPVYGRFGGSFVQLRDAGIGSLDASTLVDLEPSHGGTSGVDLTAFRQFMDSQAGIIERDRIATLAAAYAGPVSSITVVNLEVDLKRYDHFFVYQKSTGTLSRVRVTADVAADTTGAGVVIGVEDPAGAPGTAVAVTINADAGDAFVLDSIRALMIGRDGVKVSGPLLASTNWDGGFDPNTFAITDPGTTGWALLKSGDSAVNNQYIRNSLIVDSVIQGGTQTFGGLSADEVTLTGGGILRGESGEVHVYAEDGTNHGTMTVQTLRVLGDVDQVNTNELRVADQYVVVAEGQAGTPMLNGGLYLERGTGADAYLEWDEGVDRWGRRMAGGSFVPFALNDGTLQTNLNADLWDSKQFADYLDQGVRSADTPVFNGVNVIIGTPEMADLPSAYPLGVSVNGSESSAPYSWVRDASAVLTVRAQEVSRTMQLVGAYSHELFFRSQVSGMDSWSAFARVALDGMAQDFTFGGKLGVTGDATFDGRVRIAYSGDLSLASTGHPFQIGPDTGLNIAIDNNGIMARNGGGATTLNLNTEGGLVAIGGSASVASTLAVIGNATFAANVGTPSFTSQTTGWRVTNAGAADFRSIYADEMHVRAFTMDVAQALAGETILTKSVSNLAANFLIPSGAGSTAPMVVEDLPGIGALPVFADADSVLLRYISRAGGGLTVANIWGTVSGYVDLENGTQQWTFHLQSAPAGLGGETVYKGARILDYGNPGDGIIRSTVLDQMGSPYTQYETWNAGGNPEVPGSYNVLVRTGNLTGITHPQWGTLSGAGLYATNAYLDGKMVAREGYVGTPEQGWTITSTYLQNGNVLIGNDIDAHNAAKGLYVGNWRDGEVPIVKVNGTTANQYVALWSDTNASFLGADTWGIIGRDGSNVFFRLGDTNQIAGANFDFESVWAGGAKGSAGWQWNEDGSGYAAQGKFSWDLNSVNLFGWDAYNTSFKKTDDNTYALQFLSDLNGRPAITVLWDDDPNEFGNGNNYISIGAATYLKTSFGGFTPGWDYSGGGIAINVGGDPVFFAGQRGGTGKVVLSGWEATKTLLKQSNGSTGIELDSANLRMRIFNSDSEMLFGDYTTDLGELALAFSSPTSVTSSTPSTGTDNDSVITTATISAAMRGGSMRIPYKLTATADNGGVGTGTATAKLEVLDSVGTVVAGPFNASVSKSSGGLNQSKQAAFVVSVPSTAATARVTLTTFASGQGSASGASASAEINPLNAGGSSVVPAESNFISPAGVSYFDDTGIFRTALDRNDARIEARKLLLSEDTGRSGWRFEINSDGNLDVIYDQGGTTWLINTFVRPPNAS